MGNPNEHPEQAIRKFESMLQTDDVYFFDSEDFEEIIHHYLGEGKTLLAKRALEMGKAQHPQAIELKFLEIEILVSEDKLDQAQMLIEEIEVFDPMNEELFIQKANILSKSDDHQGAIDILNKALKFCPESFDVHSLLGLEYLYLDAFEEAIPHFATCLTLDSTDYASMYNLVYCYEFTEGYEEAITYLNNYLEQNPYSEVAWHQLGKMYVALEKFQEALAAFDFAVISDDRFSGAYYEKGYVLEKLGRYNEAIENYEFCFEWDAPTPQAYLRIGYCHQKLGNHSLAEQYFYKTVHLDPLLDKGWLALTKHYFVGGDLLKAQEHINKALNIDGENALFWRRAAHIYHSLGEIEKADYAFEQSIELGNFEFNSYLKWISIQLEQKDYSRAIECLLEAMEHHPEEAALLFIKSGIHALLDERDEAQNTLCQAMRLDSTAADYFYFYFEEMSELDWLKSYLEKKKPSDSA